MIIHLVHLINFFKNFFNNKERFKLLSVSIFIVTIKM
jgi:hypothetical protein